MTLPIVNDPTNCFPQHLVPVHIRGDVIAMGEITRASGRMPWTSEGLISFEKDGKAGYCDASGRIVIAPQFDPTSGGPFCSGLAVVMKDGKYGYIDKTGHPLGDIRYEWAYDFQDGVGAVEMDGKWGLLRATGDWAVVPSFKRIDLCVGGYQAESDSGESGFIHTDGSFIVDGELGKYHHPKP